MTAPERRLDAQRKLVALNKLVRRMDYRLGEASEHIANAASVLKTARANIAELIDVVEKARETAEATP